MAKTVTGEIIKRVNESKYYAFLLDCVRDASQIEQLAIIIRICNVSTGNIEKYFLGFLRMI